MATRACSAGSANFLAEVKTADPFSASRAKFEEIVGHLQDANGKVFGQTHSQVEDWLNESGRELLRRLFQDHLELREAKEPRRLSVVGSEGS